MTFYGSSAVEIHIPDSVEELCEACFFECTSLSRVTFNESSSLKLIGKEAFCLCHCREIHIPDSVEELGDNCFAYCGRLSLLTFGESSSLKRIGERAFYHCHLGEIHIPDSVEELGDGCFAECDNLSLVTVGRSSSLSLKDALVEREPDYGTIDILDILEPPTETLSPPVRVVRRK